MKSILKKFICVLLILAMIISTPISVRAASDDGDDETELDLSEIRAFDRNDNPLSDFESSKDGAIKYTRTHTVATTGNHYLQRSLRM